MVFDINRENNRLQFIQKRDGIKAAIDFANRGIKMYRSFSLKNHVHRHLMISSCVSFHKFIKSVATVEEKLVLADMGMVEIIPENEPLIVMEA